MAKNQYVVESYFNAIAELKSRELNYTTEELDYGYMIKITFNGDDLPMPFKIIFHTEYDRCTLLSHIPCKIGDDKRVEGAVVTCIASNNLSYGNFEYDLESGEIWYRLVQLLDQNPMLGETFYRMMSIACNTVDDYNDKFLMFSKGKMDIKEFS